MKLGKIVLIFTLFLPALGKIQSNPILQMKVSLVSGNKVIVGLKIPIGSVSRIPICPSALQGALQNNLVR